MKTELQQIGLELFLKTSNDAIYIEDEQDNIVEVNQKACDLLGYTRGELLSKQVSDLQAPEYNDPGGNIVRRDVEVSLNKPFETAVLHKDGRIIPVEITVSLLKEFKGGHFIACAIARDLTERKKAEEKARFSETLLRFMMESPEKILIWAVDREGRYLFFNRHHKERMKEVWNADIEMGKVPFDYIDDPEYKKTCKIYYTNILEGQSHYIVDEVTDQNGATRYFENFSSPIKDAEQKVIGAVAYAIEITDRKKTELALAKSLEEKKILLKEVHHRVKNNLTIISSLLSMHTDSIESEKDINIFLSCQNRIASMSKMHEQLYQAEDLRNISMRDYIYSIVQTVHATYQRDGTNIEMNVDIDDIHLDMDSSVPVGLIVNELVSNSFKHAFKTQQTGIIEIALKQQEDGAMSLFVRDNGRGIADETSLKKSPSLGFSLIQALADQLSGSIEISGKNGLQVSLTFSSTPSV